MCPDVTGVSRTDACGTRSFIYISLYDGTVTEHMKFVHTEFKQIVPVYIELMLSFP